MRRLNKLFLGIAFISTILFSSCDRLVDRWLGLPDPIQGGRTLEVTCKGLGWREKTLTDEWEIEAYYISSLINVKEELGTRDTKFWFVLDNVQYSINDNSYLRIKLKLKREEPLELNRKYYFDYNIETLDSELFIEYRTYPKDKGDVYTTAHGFIATEGYIEITDMVEFCGGTYITYNIVATCEDCWGETGSIKLPSSNPNSLLYEVYSKPENNMGTLEFNLSVINTHIKYTDQAWQDDVDANM